MFRYCLIEFASPAAEFLTPDADAHSAGSFRASALRTRGDSLVELQALSAQSPLGR